MRKIDDWVTVLIHLMKDVVSEELDDVSIACFGPARLTGEPKIKVEMLFKLSSGRRTRVAR